MKRSIFTRCAAAFAAVSIAYCSIATTGCTRHEVVTDTKTMKLTTDPGSKTIGHITSRTVGLAALFIFPFMPGADGDGNSSFSLAYTYNKMAEEASGHGAKKLLDLSSSKAMTPIFFIFLQMFEVQLSANMTN